MGLRNVRFSDMLSSMDAADVIAKMGGPVAVSRRFGAPRTAVYNWRRDGIPARYWIEFQEAVKADGLDIPLDAIRWRPRKARRPVAHGAAQQRAGAD